MIRGNSGCVLTVVDNTRIIKNSSSKNYSDRLTKQYEKQIQFSNINKLAHFKSPKVFRHWRRKNLFYFEMEYCNGSDFINYLNLFGTNEIEDLIDKIIQLIEQYEANCEYKEIEFKIIEKKFFKTIKYLKEKKDVKILRNIFDTFETNNIYLPIGICHGDLTFSNILYHGKDIVLIDYLDSFIESPLFDIVKVRQDTYYYWSLNFTCESFDAIKMKTILQHIDGKIDQYFHKKDYYCRYYTLFQFINLVRTLPYCDDIVVYNHVIENIKKNYLQ